MTNWSFLEGNSDFLCYFYPQIASVKLGKNTPEGYRMGLTPPPPPPTESVHRNVTFFIGGFPYDCSLASYPSTLSQWQSFGQSDSSKKSNPQLQILDCSELYKMSQEITEQTKKSILGSNFCSNSWKDLPWLKINFSVVILINVPRKAWKYLQTVQCAPIRILLPKTGK